MKRVTIAAVLVLGSCGDASDPSGTPSVDLCTLAHDVFNSSAKVQANSQYRWSCTATVRTVAGNGIPDHPVEEGSFATPISAQTIAESFPLSPAKTEVATNTPDVAYAINSVKFDPATAASCTSTATGTRAGKARPRKSDDTGGLRPGWLSGLRPIRLQRC